VKVRATVRGVIVSAAMLSTFWISGGGIAGEKIGHRPERADPPYVQEEKALRALGAAYVKAFNAGDARAVSSFWMPQGDFIGAAGALLRGREAIAKDYATFFADNPGVQLEIEPEQIRFPVIGVAIEDGVARLRSASAEPLSTCRYAVTHVKKDGKWLMASVRELPHEAASNYERLRELEWLIGTWTARNGNISVEQTCEWAASKNFMVRKYAVKEAKAILRKGMQIIGWDPTGGGIRSWFFAGDGGFGQEKWTRDGKSWTLEVDGVERAGAEIQAVNIITRVNNNTWTWQSVHRTIDGVSLPDTAAVTLTRVIAKK